MMALPRLLLPAVAVVLLAACGTSPVGEFGGEKAEMTALTGGTAPHQPVRPPKMGFKKTPRRPAKTPLFKRPLCLCHLSPTRAARPTKLDRGMCSK